MSIPKCSFSWVRGGEEVKENEDGCALRVLFLSKHAGKKEGGGGGKRWLF